MFGEDIVKANVEASGSIMVFARPENETFTPMQNRRTSSGLKVWENFSICPEVSLGPNQKLILCDENTLKQTQGSPIFDSLTLIVNCHQSEEVCKPKKYKIGSCSSNDPPKVISNAVHEWWTYDEEKVNAVNNLNHSI